MLWNSNKPRIHWNRVLSIKKRASDYWLRLTLGLGCLHLCCCSSNVCSLERTDLATECNLFSRRSKCKETAVSSNKIIKKTQQHKTFLSHSFISPSLQLFLKCTTHVHLWDFELLVIICGAWEKSWLCTYMWTREKYIFTFFHCYKNLPEACLETRKMVLQRTHCDIGKEWNHTKLHYFMIKLWMINWTPPTL